MAAVLAMTGLAFAGGSARAGVSAPTATAGAIARQVAAAFGATAVTAPGGDLTINVDPGISYDPTVMQQLITQVQGENTHLSDTFKRMFEQASASLPAGTAGAQDFSTTANWVDVDGTLAMDSDHTGLSVTIPAAEVQALSSGSTWETLWHQVVAALAGGTAMLLVRTGCVGFVVSVFGPIGVLGKTVCASIGNFIGAFIRGWILQYFDGTLKSAAAWAVTVVESLVAAVPPSLWEAGINRFAETTMAAWMTSFGNWMVNSFVPAMAWLGTRIGNGIVAVAGFIRDVATAIPGAVRNLSVPTSPSGLSCDIYTFYSTPCTAAYSMDRALYSYYGGPLYQVHRASDGTTADIGLLSAGGDVNAAEQNSFCANTSCTVTKLYDQSPEWNDLNVAPGGEAAPNPDNPADAAALPITIGGLKAYGLDIEPGMGYRNNVTQGIAKNGQPEGMYMVASGTHANPACCFDFGNAESDSNDHQGGTMDAVNLSTRCWDYTTCTGNGPWVQADLEDGLFMGSTNTNRANLGNSTNFVTALLKNNGQDTFALKGGDAKTGALTTWYDGPLPPGRYTPMKQQGGIILGTGGDNSNWGVGSFFEGVMTAGYPSDAADNAVQANIVAAGYSGDSAGSTQASAAGPAVAHSGYASVYTVTSGGHLQETYDSAIGQPWATQDLSATGGDLPGTPKVMAGTEPVAVTHDGYTSVYTVDASNGDLQETFLPAIGDAWQTQDLSTFARTPPTNVTPTAVFHDGYTSVYTVNRSGRHLQETFLPALGAGWTTQDLTVLTSGPDVLAGTSPVAVYHDGYTSVYTVNGGKHLQETFLPALGAGWFTQDLTALTNGSDTTVTPTAVYHSGYTSVYTVDTDGHLRETYLSALGAGWLTQDLTALTNPTGPTVLAGTSPVALYHSGYTSVYTVDTDNHLHETFLPALGAGWSTQDMKVKFSTPPTAQTPIALLHAGADGALDWTSVYTFNEDTDDLQETYLTAIGQQWVTKTLSSTPPAADPDADQAGASAVAHDGYTSEYTVNTNGDLEETFLTAADQPWAAQDLSSKAKTPAVMPGTKPVAVAHDGYTSVYTIDASDGDLQETWLSAIGAAWQTQDLSAVTSGPPSDDTPAAVFHDGYVSVYTVDRSNGHLRETWLPALGAGWSTQDLTVKGGTPPVLAGTSPAAVYHSTYTSVYTVDASHDLQETWLPAIGAGWITQDLSAVAHTPPTTSTPAAVFHDGYTSVYTVDDPTRDLQETYLPAIGDGWITQDMTAKYLTPPVASGTAPVALYHTGYASVYTVDQGSDHLQETYLTAVTSPWVTQDLTVKGGTPATVETPAAVVHADANGGLTWTSVYTMDQATDHLQETYLQALGDPWVSKDLSAQANAGTPSEVATDDFPTAGASVAHDGYTSMYTVDANGDLQETYDPAIGQPWVTQDLSAMTVKQKVMAGTTPVVLTGNGNTAVYTVDPNGALFETYLAVIGGGWSTFPLGQIFPAAATNVTPAAVLHDEYSSVYTVAKNGDLWETYQPERGSAWVTQDLSSVTSMPPGDPSTSPVAIFHDGYVSVYTIGKNGDLQETYLPALGAGWKTQDLSAIYHVPGSHATPGAVFHDGYVSVYTVATNGNLWETYLPAIGDAWVKQDLSAIYPLQAALTGIAPVALYHNGYTSVYTIDSNSGHLRETYLPAIGDSWSTVDMTTYQTPVTGLTPPSALLHYDANGGLTWTSVFTSDLLSGNLDETYLSALGSPWTTQVLP